MREKEHAKLSPLSALDRAGDKLRAIVATQVFRRSMTGDGHFQHRDDVEGAARSRRMHRQVRHQSLEPGVLLRLRLTLRAVYPECLEGVLLKLLDI